MPLQNRVNPYGEICFSSHRGQLMGNRGRLHNEAREIVRDYLGKRWIICLLEFKDRHQEVMRPGRYTELFFLDEATALSAGHRPCAQCQYQRFQAFLSCWKAANQQPDIDLEHLDEILHLERTVENHSLYLPEELSDGVLIEYENKPFLIFSDRLWEWSFAGYGQPQAIPFGKKIRLLTPYSIVRAIAGGFTPSVHQSATASG